MIYQNGDHLLKCNIYSIYIMMENTIGCMLNINLTMQEYSLTFITWSLLNHRINVDAIPLMDYVTICYKAHMHNGWLSETTLQAEYFPLLWCHMINEDFVWSHSHLPHTVDYIDICISSDWLFSTPTAAFPLWLNIVITSITHKFYIFLFYLCIFH